MADASVGWAGAADAAVGGVSVGAYSTASASLALIASQFCCINSGWYPTLIFLGLESLS